MVVCHLIFTSPLAHTLSLSLCLYRSRLCLAHGAFFFASSLCPSPIGNSSDHRDDRRVGKGAAVAAAAVPCSTPSWQ
uniref:Putative secreted protein n=1 Tax=Anopheles darlingi TaxID=43151 RepID=A0A2M4D0X2_ANODA